MTSSTARWLLSVLLLTGGRVALAQESDQAVRDSVRSFCDFEFNGAQEPSQRAELVQFSDSRLADIKQVMGDINPYVFEWQASPLEVIESFNVSNVRISGSQAYADVDYVVVARRDAWSGPIKGVSRNTAHSQLKLTQVGTRWKVTDPPYPMVSRTFLSTSYRRLFQLPETWYQHASRAQLLWLRNALDNILLLDSLFDADNLGPPHKF
jgi:hypothetical protein